MKQSTASDKLEAYKNRLHYRIRSCHAWATKVSHILRENESFIYDDDEYFKILDSLDKAKEYLKPIIQTVNDMEHGVNNNGKKIHEAIDIVFNMIYNAHDEIESYI